MKKQLYTNHSKTEINYLSKLTSLPIVYHPSPAGLYYPLPQTSFFTRLHLIKHPWKIIYQIQMRSLNT